jgi:hypothetical protein
VQALGEVHDTPLKPANGTLGVCWTDHVVPFQISASGGLPVPVNVWPTATQNVAEVQETPTRVLEGTPGGLGVCWTDHLVPFHTSARVTCAPARSRRAPTAMQKLGEVHDTAVRRLSRTSGLGVGWMAQAAPVACVLECGWCAAGLGVALAAGAVAPARMRAATAAPAASEAASLRWEACRGGVTGEPTLVI